MPRRSHGRIRATRARARRWIFIRSIRCPRPWWAYLGALRSRYRCAAVLVVVTPSARVARWARTPIPLGHPGTTLTPLVIGPDDVPVVDDATLALADPELGVLSAIVHGHSTAAIAIARAVFIALGQLDDERTR